MRANTAAAVGKALRVHARKERVPLLQRFFKTGPGEYAEGDQMLGIYVPDLRRAIKPFDALPLAEIEKLLQSPWHEERLAALQILLRQFERAQAPASRRAIFDFYLAHTAHINNWDLVDTSAAEIVGRHLYLEGKGHARLKKLAKSSDLWQRRIGIIATHHFIKQKEFTPVREVSVILLRDKHDLIHKAVGWMLREAGKRDVTVLRAFLDEHAAVMPRTALRYAIERLPVAERKRYMARG